MQHHIIKTTNDLEYAERFLKQNLVISLDTETTGLDWMRSNIFALALTSNNHTFVFSHNYSEIFSKLPIFLISIFDDSHVIIGHSIKFDMHMLYSTFNVEFLNNRWHDTKLMAYLLNENRKNGLKFLAKEILGNETIKANEVEKFFKENHISKEHRDYTRIPNDLLISYVAEDSINTYNIFFNLYPSIQTYFLDLYTQECKILKILYKMEKNGLPINTNELNNCTKKIEEENRVLYDDLISQSHINLNSSQQLGEFLKEKLHIQLTKLTPKGRPSVDISALSDILHPFVRELLSYRHKEKLLSTYLYPYAHHVYDNKIHGNYSITKTTTGRFSSYSPNVQNIPKNKDIQKIFVCEPNTEMVFYDQSQIEMLGFIFYSQEPRLLKLAQEKKDLYKLTAQEVLNRVPTNEERQIFKAVTLSLIYGVGNEKLYSYFHSQGVNISNKEAKHFREEFFKKFPGIKAFQSNVISTIKLYRQPWGHHVKNVFGRVRRLNPQLAYTGINHLIQGWAADLMKDAMIRIEEKFKPQWRHQIHDAIRIDFPLSKSSNSDILIEKIGNELTSFSNCSIPIQVKTTRSQTTWAEAK